MLTTVWGISSRLVHVTVVPTATLIVAGPKLKLSIFTSAVDGAACCAFAAACGDPANSSPNATVTAVAIPAIHRLLLFMICFLSNLVRIDFEDYSESLLAYSSVESTTANACRALCSAQAMHFRNPVGQLRRGCGRAETHLCSSRTSLPFLLL